jgi:hypothetical protein
LENSVLYLHSKRPISSSNAMRPPTKRHSV